MEPQISKRSEEDILKAGINMRNKFKGCVPVLVIVDKKAMIDLKKEMFVCKPEHNFINLAIQIRKQIKLEYVEGLYYLSKSNKLFTFQDTIGELDKKYCDDGGFLIVVLCKENCFG